MMVLAVLVVLLSYQPVFTLCYGLQPIQTAPRSEMEIFLHGLLTPYQHHSVGGACFFGPSSSVWWQGTHLRKGFHPIRMCSGVSACLAMQPTEETKCELIVVIVKGGVYQQMLHLSLVSYWSSRAVHVFVWENSMPLDSDEQIASSVLSFGIVRVLLIHVSSTAQQTRIRFPILFQRTSIPVNPSEALHWLASFNQIADLHGFRYNTLYYLLIPNLYRHDGIFGGPDYRFLQTVLLRQNATHSWFYHHSDDIRFNTSDLAIADRSRLETRRVTFSLNRLLQTDANSMEKLYLNTFDGMCVLVPRKPLRTFILKLWQPFSQYLWYAVLSIVMLAILGNLTMPRVFVVNYILALLFGSKSVDYRLKAFDRTILSTLDTLLFLLKEAYTAKIITYMIQSKYEPELETLVQLAASGPPLLLSTGDYASVNESLRNISGLRIEFRKTFSTLTTNWREYFLPTFAHVIPCSYGRALVGSHAMYEQDAPKFYILREKLLIQPEAFTFPLNSPFINRIRFFVQSLWESGIYGSWFSEDYYTQDRTPTLDEVLKFENLASLFYVLLIGCAVALVVFGIEHSVAFVRQRVKMKRLVQVPKSYIPKGIFKKKAAGKKKIRTKFLC
uniref:Ionotropic glutamate receptor L-glutamate and glycine-binding domain-containing protein n=1 Tax=Anopheles minimus TaxID=112268 RepID=A0A182VUH2_9DIPT